MLHRQVKLIYYRRYSESLISQYKSSLPVIVCPIIQFM